MHKHVFNSEFLSIRCACISPEAVNKKGRQDNTGSVYFNVHAV